MSGGIKFNPRSRPREWTGHTRLLRDAPGLAAARQGVGLTVEELAEITDVGAGRIRNLEAGGFEIVLAVSSLQAYFARQHGIDIWEPPS
jgi:hypothetical protein